MDHFAGLDVSVKETSVCIVVELDIVSFRPSQLLQRLDKAGLR